MTPSCGGSSPFSRSGWTRRCESSPSLSGCGRSPTRPTAAGGRHCSLLLERCSYPVQAAQAPASLSRRIGRNEEKFARMRALARSHPTGPRRAAAHLGDSASISPFQFGRGGPGGWWILTTGAAPGRRPPDPRERMACPSRRGRARCCRRREGSTFRKSAGLRSRRRRIPVARRAGPDARGIRVAGEWVLGCGRTRIGHSAITFSLGDLWA